MYGWLAETEPTIGYFITFPFKLMCNVMFDQHHLSTLNRQYRIIQTARVDSPSTTQQTKQTGEDSRHVMVCQWYISKNCVQMYEVIRLMLVDRNRSYCLIIVWFSYRRDFLTLAILLWGKLGRNYFFLRDCTLGLYFLRGKSNTPIFGKTSLSWSSISKEKPKVQF